MAVALVTGGAGFIGSNLIGRLLRENYEVICLDNFSTGREINLNQFQHRIKVINHDIRNQFPEMRVDMIFHLACPASPPQYQKDPLYTLETNYVGTKNVLEFALKNKCELLFASTSEIYGDPTVHPQAETYFGNVNTLGPRACYDEGKRVAETICYLYNQKFKIPIKIVRIFNTYGPNMDPADGRVVSNFIIQTLSSQPITIYGDGSQTRSFCYVDDLIEGIWLISRYQTRFDVFNLGNDQEIEIISLAKLVQELIGKKTDVRFLPLPENDPIKRRPDLTKVSTLVGWKPKTPLSQGLKITIEYFKTTLKIE